MQQIKKLVLPQRHPLFLNVLKLLCVTFVVGLMIYHNGPILLYVMTVGFLTVLILSERTLGLADHKVFFPARSRMGSALGFKKEYNQINKAVCTLTSNKIKCRIYYAQSTFSLFDYSILYFDLEDEEKVIQHFENRNVKVEVKG